MNCWKCFKWIREAPLKIGFREACPHCGVDLHTCSHCRYYMPGKPNDCAVPGTEYVRDREAHNFCEEFKVKENPSSPPPDQKKKFNALFKDED